MSSVYSSASPPTDGTVMSYDYHQTYPAAYPLKYADYYSCLGYGYYEQGPQKRGHMSTYVTPSYSATSLQNGQYASKTPDSYSLSTGCLESGYLSLPRSGTPSPVMIDPYLSSPHTTGFYQDPVGATKLEVVPSDKGSFLTSVPSTNGNMDNNSGSGDSSKKPDDSYIAMVSMAILSSPNETMILADIYKHMQEHYPYFKVARCSWRNSVRHNLSTHGCFIKARRAHNGKGFYWGIHPSCIESFRCGNFDRRLAKRRVQHSLVAGHGPGGGQTTPRDVGGADGPQSPGCDSGYSSPLHHPLESSPRQTEEYIAMETRPVSAYHAILDRKVVKRPTKKQKTELYKACAHLLGYC